MCCCQHAGHTGYVHEGRRLSDIRRKTRLHDALPAPAPAPAQTPPGRCLSVLCTRRTLSVGGRVHSTLGSAWYSDGARVVWCPGVDAHQRLLDLGLRKPKGACPPDPPPVPHLPHLLHDA